MKENELIKKLELTNTTLEDVDDAENYRDFYNMYVDGQTGEYIDKHGFKSLLYPLKDILTEKEFDFLKTRRTKEKENENL